MSRVSANLLLSIVALIWGSAFVAQSYGMAHVAPMTFTGVRFLIGALVVAPLIWIEWGALSRQGRLPQYSDAMRIVGLGLLLGLGAAMQQIGIAGTSVTNAGFLTALYIPLVPVMGWLILRHLPHWPVWLAGLACVFGAFLLSGADLQIIGDGDLWVMASAIPWALHVLLVGRVAHRMEAPFLVAGGQFAICGLLATLWALAFEPVSFQGLLAATGALLYTGVFSVGIAFTAQVVAQRYTHAADAAIVLSSETLFAAMFGYVLMGDRITTTGLLGCALILASLVVVQIIPLAKKSASTC
jgi:drug/metabolite transporter (DMT)-like permease